MKSIDRVQSSLAHDSAGLAVDADAVHPDRCNAAVAKEKVREIGINQESLRLLLDFKSSCFANRIAAPSIYGMGYVTRGTVISVSRVRLMELPDSPVHRASD
jgi:hypothetical protein